MFLDRFGKWDNSERKVKKVFRHPSMSALKVLHGTSWERPGDIPDQPPRDVKLGPPQDGQIGSLGDVLGTLEGDVLRTYWRPIFPSWVKLHLEECLDSGFVPSWLTKGKTVLLQKDEKKSNMASNYRPVTCLSWKLSSGVILIVIRFMGI